MGMLTLHYKQYCYCIHTRVERVVIPELAGHLFGLSDKRRGESRRGNLGRRSSLFCKIHSKDNEEVS